MNTEESSYAGFHLEKPVPECRNRAKELYFQTELVVRDARKKAAKDEEMVLITIIGNQSFFIHSLGYDDSDFMHVWGTNSNGEQFEIISPVEQTSFMTLIAKKAEERPRRQIGFLGAVTPPGNG